jgi:ADP-heptose:LPS heptosyltransferase
MAGHELHRNAIFLEHLGLDTTGYEPRVWMSAGDRLWADEKLEQLGLKDRPFIVLFAGAQLHRRGYMGYGPALAECFTREPVPVVAVGAASDRSDNQANLDAYPGPSFNLCGETDLPQLAAIVSLARLAFGAETGVSHVACAMGVPQVVLLGGGHFGRFHPYSHLTTLACLPLDCFGCGWECRYSRAHCIQDVSPGLLAAALRETWATPSSVARILHPAEATNRPGGPQDASPDTLPVWAPVQWKAWPRGGRP